MVLHITNNPTSILNLNMIENTKGLLESLSAFIRRLNQTSLKRIIIYVIIIYPLVFGIYYKKEILELFKSHKDNQVKVRKLDVANNRCFELREIYGAEAVMLYVYQPNSSRKTSKERIAISVGSVYKPLEENNRVELITRTHVIEDLRTDGVAKITKSSGHVLSNVIFSYGLDVAYIVPIKDIGSNSIIGEVIYVFKEDKNYDINALITSAQMFSYDI
ncbi:hypothetical protein [Tenacibaculum phage PTm5]|uniref:Uncharacterized protein n=1 Tax=Tenacibaculum phage PTm5 TaxID=2547426 RepID=A0A5S9C1I9_9CAUD|nr:hypothetical protein [Tenacibaculum phage PTm5]